MIWSGAEVMMLILGNSCKYKWGFTNSPITQLYRQKATSREHMHFCLDGSLTCTQGKPECQNVHITGSSPQLMPNRDLGVKHLRLLTHHSAWGTREFGVCVYTGIWGPGGTKLQLPSVFTCLVTHSLLAAIHSLSHFLIPLQVFLGIGSQINCLYFSWVLLSGDYKLRWYNITIFFQSTTKHKEYT